jgi:hypothetical protein
VGPGEARGARVWEETRAILRAPAPTRLRDDRQAQTAEVLIEGQAGHASSGVVTTTKEMFVAERGPALPARARKGEAGDLGDGWVL